MSIRWHMLVCLFVLVSCSMLCCIAGGGEARCSSWRCARPQVACFPLRGIGVMSVIIDVRYNCWVRMAGLAHRVVAAASAEVAATSIFLRFLSVGYRQVWTTQSSAPTLRPMERSLMHKSCSTITRSARGVSSDMCTSWVYVLGSNAGLWWILTILT
jgi:hypothetical protein